MPVTRERVAGQLDRIGKQWTVDSDGDFVIAAEECLYFCQLSDSAIRFVGVWRGIFPSTADELDRAKEVAREINDRLLVPKCVVDVAEQVIYGETTMETGCGMTDGQIFGFVHQSIAGCTTMAAALTDVLKGKPSCGCGGVA